MGGVGGSDDRVGAERGRREQTDTDWRERERARDPFTTPKKADTTKHKLLGTQTWS